MSVSTILKNPTLLIILVVILGLTVLAAIQIADQRTATYQTLVTTQINEQTQRVSTLAEATARTQVANTVGAIVQDCPLPKRVEFDQLLGQLDDGLSRADLLTLDQLFDACANIQALRKAVMVDRLNREIAVLDTYSQQLQSLKGQSEPLVDVATWQAVAALEATQSDGFAGLVVAQKQIIDALLEGKTADSPEMIMILDTVREIQESLLLSNTQAAQLRAGLAQ